MVQNPIPSHILRYTLRLVSWIDYSFEQWSVVSFAIKKPFVFIYGERVYILNYTDVLIPIC